MSEAGKKLVVKTRAKGGVEYTNGMFRIDLCIASYPHLAEPKAGEDGGEPKFSITGLLDKTEHAGIIKLMADACRRIMADKKLKIASDKLFIKDGDKYFEEKEECKGRYVVTARESTRPTLRDAAGNKLNPKTDLEEIKQMFYGGCIVSILINPWVQDNKYGKRINANLRAVRFMEDGTPFGEGRIDDDDAWDDIESSGESDFDDDGDI